MLLLQRKEDTYLIIIIIMIMIMLIMLMLMLRIKLASYYAVESFV